MSTDQTPHEHEPGEDREHADRAPHSFGPIRTGLAVLSCFTDTQALRRCAQVARQAGLPRAIVYQRLSTLTMLGYLEETEDQRYRLSSRTFGSGIAVSSARAPRNR